jgi:hypothetical protein
LNKMIDFVVVSNMLKFWVNYRKVAQEQATALPAYRYMKRNRVAGKPPVQRTAFICFSYPSHWAASIPGATNLPVRKKRQRFKSCGEPGDRLWTGRKQSFVLVSWRY